MSTGARSELFAPTTAMIDACYELDMKNGYAASFIEQPTGPTISHRGRFLDSYATYVSHCMVEITEPLILGCFAVRVQQARGSELFYPIEPGWYETLLWKEEIEVAVLTLPSAHWLELISQFGCRNSPRFAELMTQLRDSAPEEIVDWIKLAIVGGIGRHGSPWETTTIVMEGEQDPGDTPVAWNGLAYDWYIHSAMQHIPESMQHWFSHTLMKCRLELYRYALPYARRGELLATNTDAVFVKESADVSGVIAKEDGAGKPAGTWRKSKLTKQEGKPMFPALRHVISEQKVRRPGVPREEKE